MCQWCFNAMCQIANRLPGPQSQLRWWIWRPVSKYHQLQSRQPLHLLTASRVPICCDHLDVPGVFSQGSTASCHFRRSIILFSLRCQHSLRLQRAATERDGVRFSQQVYVK